MDPTACRIRSDTLMQRLISRRSEIPVFVAEFRGAATPEEKTRVLERWGEMMKEITAIRNELAALESEERSSTAP